MSFETLTDYMKRLPLEEQREIEAGAEAMARAIEAAGKGHKTSPSGDLSTGQTEHPAGPKKTAKR